MGKLPLDGIRVLDSTYIFAMPYAAGILADLGAEVIKIEGPTHTDGIRGGAFSGAYADMIPGEDPWNRAASFSQLNHGKRSLTLDLSQDKGRDALRELVRVSDVLIENYTPRVMRRWELDFPNLKKIKPDIIMVSNTGYGHGEGPWSMWPAQATTQEATHGHCWITGYNGDMPSKAGASFVDFLACWTGLFAIASALHYRNRTGRGQWIDVAMYQLGVYGTSEYILDFVANGRLGERIGNRHAWRAPQGCYPCAGKDQWCVLSVGDDEEWAALCRVMGREELIEDPRYADSLSRMKDHDELDGVLAEWTRTQDKYSVMEQLQGAGVPSGPLFDSRNANLDPHYWARGFLQKVTFPPDRKMGTRVLMREPWQMSKAPLSIKSPGPKLAADNVDILQRLLNLSPEECAEMEKAKIISNAPIDRRPVVSDTLEAQVRRGRLAYYDTNYKQVLGIEG